MSRNKKTESEKPVKKPSAPPIDSKMSESEEAAPKRVRMIETLRGIRDILPQEGPYWQWLWRIMDRLAEAYQYQWIGLPTIEPAQLFIRTVGKQTDIVEKEMYRFTDQGGEDVVLRPELTASLARAYANHGMLNLPQPVKLYYSGSAFRYDRPQAGRYREFHQIGFEVLGSDSPVADAELIILAWNFIHDLGLSPIVQVNSIGNVEARAAYGEKLVAHYRAHRLKLCEDCKRRLGRNPLRLLDCKQDNCREVRADAPQILDSLDEESKNHFMRVLEYLDEVEVPYVLNPYLVRGLDYYNRTVFELMLEEEDERSQSALGGGGRYDGLVELVGGRPTPGVGFALGVERIITALKAKDIAPPKPEPPLVFVAQLGEQSKRRAMKLFEELRRAGLSVAQSFVKDALKVQLETANRLGVRFTLILGQKEVLDGTMIIRDMDSGVQEIIDQQKIVVELKKKVGNSPRLVGGPSVIPEPLAPAEEEATLEVPLDEEGSEPPPGIIPLDEGGES